MLKGRLTEPQCIFTNTADVQELLKQAKLAYENYLIRSSEKDLESAIDYYAEAISLDPTIPESYYRLASLLWETGRIDINTAMLQCQKALSIEPNSPNARLHLGYFLKAAEKIEDAEKEFLKSIKLSGLFSSKARLALGLTIVQSLNSNKVDFKRLVKGLYYFLSGASLILIDFNSLKMLFKSIIDDLSYMLFKTTGKIFKNIKKYNAAINIYEKGAEITGKTDIFYSEIADLSIMCGNPYNAVKYYQNAIQNSPDNPILWTKLTSVLERYYNNNVSEIIDCYNKLYELEPNNSKILYELGHLHFKLNDNFSALNYFKKASEQEKCNPYYHNSLAYVLVQLQDYDGAIEEYQKAIKLNPDNEWTSIVSQALGAIYLQVKNNIDAAIVAYQTSIVLDPLNVDAYVSLGEAYQNKNDYDNAIECYCEAVKLEPSASTIYARLGMVLWEQDFAEESIIAYEKAVQINKKYDIAYNNLGVVYLDGTGNIDKAFDSFNKAIEINPSYALAYYNRGRAFEIIKNKAKAAESYQMAVDINKITEELDEAEVLDKLYSLFDA